MRKERYATVQGWLVAGSIVRTMPVSLIALPRLEEPENQ
jgi:hypothetical protein